MTTIDRLHAETTLLSYDRAVAIAQELNADADPGEYYKVVPKGDYGIIEYYERGYLMGTI